MSQGIKAVMSLAVILIAIFGIAVTAATLQQDKLNRLQKVEAVIAEQPRGDHPRATVAWEGDSKEVSVPDNARKGDKISVYVNKEIIVEEDTDIAGIFIGTFVFLSIFAGIIWLGYWAVKLGY